MSERLYPVPDKTRTSWCFLVLKTEDAAKVPRVVGWEVSVANAHRVIDNVESHGAGPEDEGQVLAELCKELQQYQHDNTTLHTIDDKSLSLLRTRLVVADTDAPQSLRGLHHVSLQDVLDLFGPWWKVVLETTGVLNVDESHEIDKRPSALRSLSSRDLWAVRRCVAPLVPVEVLQGNPL